MKFIKTVEGHLKSYNDNSLFISESEYNKATIIYDKEYEVYVTEDVNEEITDTDAKGKTIILGTRVVQKPKLDKEGNPLVKKEIKEVRYNPYDEQGVVIIPDDATILTEEEYKKEIEKMKPKEEKKK